MSNQTFTPSDAVDLNKEKDWAAKIGMMDWDTTKIVFTKRTLIEFLKYTGITVDTNFSNISKLPRYATFGKISSEPSAAPANGEGTASEAELAASPSKEGSDFRPSRRVRTTPGGPSSNLFEEEFADDALSQAPPKAANAEPTSPPTATVAKTDPTDVIPLPASGVRPSRRVRTAPGGKDSLAGGLWGDPDSNDFDFKPTRRVRQGPGGQDSVASLLG